MKKFIMSLAPVTFLAGLVTGIMWVGEPQGFIGVGVIIVSSLVPW